MNRRPSISLKFAPLFFLASAAVLPHSVKAVDRNWVGGDGNFDSTATTAGWNGAKPGTGDNAFINGGATVTITTDQGVIDLRAGTIASQNGTIIQNAGNVTTTGWIRLGLTAGSTGRYDISGGTLNVNANGRLNIGGANGGTGILNLSGTGVVNTTTGGTIRIGGGDSPDSSAGTGTLNVTGGTLNSNSEVWVGQGAAASSGTLNISAGTVATHNWVAVGRASASGTINLSGGVLTHDGTANANGRFSIGSGGGGAGNGTMNQTGGTFTDSTQLIISEVGTANYNISGGTVNANGGISMAKGATSATLTLQNGIGLTGALANGGGNEVVNTTTLIMGDGTGVGTSTVNLNGGTLALNTFAAGANTGAKTINFNGGLLQARTTSATFLGGTAITANVLADGARIDTNGQSVTNTTPLLHSGAVTDGGLTKLGAGTLNQTSGASSYNGVTTITAGTLGTSVLANGGANSSIGASSNDAANLVFNGGTLQYNGGTTSSDRNFTIVAGKTATIDVSNVATALTLTGGSAATNGNLVKTGVGTLILAGTNLHTGSYTSNGGLLSATGTNSNAFSVGTGGRLGAGYQSIGTLSVPTLNLGAGSGADFDLTGASSSDVITIANAGGLTLGTTALNLFQSGGSIPFAGNGTYTLFDYNTSYSGTLAGAFSIGNSQLGKLYNITDNIAATTIDLVISDATVSAWASTGAGSWNTSGNWSAGVPNTAGAVATFGAAITAPSAVTVDGPKTVGSIQFDNASAYTLSGGPSDTITLDNGIAVPIVAVTNGSHIIAAPVVMTKGVNLNTNGGTTLRLSSTISGAGPLSATGAGTVVLSGTNTYTGATSINSGILEIGSTGALAATSSLTEKNGALLRLNATGTVLSSTLNFDLNGAAAVAVSGAANGTGNFGIEVTGSNNATIAGQFNNTSGSFVKTGPGTLTLTNAGANSLSNVAGLGTVVQNGGLVLNGGAAATYSVTGAELTIGDNTPNVASVTLNSGTLNVGTYLSVGRGNGTTGLQSSFTMNGGVLNVPNLFTGYSNNVPGYSTNPLITINGGQVNATTLRLSESAGANSILNLTAGNIAVSGNAEIGFGARAKLNISSGATMTVSGVLDPGTNAGGIGQINNAGSLTIGSAQLAINATSAGALNNTGTLTVTSGAATTHFAIGNAAGSYGYFRNAGSGTATLQEVGLGGANNGNGVIDLQGGTVNNVVWFTPNRGAGGVATPQSALLNIGGGTYNLPNSTQAQMNWGVNQFAQIDVSGTGTLAGLGAASELDLNRTSDATNSGTLTIGTGGTVQLTSIKSSAALGTGVVNFNGGTLKANAATATLLNTNVTGAYVHAAGATINTNGFTVTEPEALLAPTGNGVSAIALTNTGEGYIGRPIVRITGGGGIGATAVANYNAATGEVTGITVTSPGSGYTSTPTVTLIGGGGTTTAGLGATTLAANTGNGGLTKTGAGNLILSAANTYTGTTTVAAGTLTLSSTGSLGDSPTNNIDVQTGATLDVSALAGGTLATTSSRMITGNGAIVGNLSFSGSGVLSPGDGGTAIGTLTTSGSISLSSTSSILITINNEDAAGMDRIANTGLFSANGATLTVAFNDATFTTATSAADFASATRYTFVTGPVDATTFGNFTLLSATDATNLGLSGSQYEASFSGQRFLLETGSFKLVPIAPVPEPAVAGLALAGLGLALRRRRR